MPIGDATCPHCKATIGSAKDVNRKLIGRVEESRIYVVSCGSCGYAIGTIAAAEK